MRGDVIPISVLETTDHLAIGAETLLFVQFGDRPGSAQGLLALCSGVTLGCSQGTGGDTGI